MNFLISKGNEIQPEHMLTSCNIHFQSAVFLFE